MRASRRTITFILASIVACGTLGMAGTAQAAGNNSKPTPPAITYDTSIARPQALGTRNTSLSSGAPTLAASVSSALSPAGCTGYTDYPHKSGTMASVHGRMICNYPVSYVVTSTSLTRDRWYGLETIATDTSGREVSSKSYDATPHATCLNEGTYSYRGFSSHLSSEGGVSYTSNTSNWQDPGVSRFAC